MKITIHDAELIEKAINTFEYRDGALYRKGEKASRVGARGYLWVSLACKKHYEHRIIFAMHHGYLPEMIDHIDGNPLNNRVENLRACTYSQNNCNKTKQSNNTSGFVGVTWDGFAKKWKAQLNVDGKKINIGRFATKEAANDAVTQARSIHHGEFARYA